MFYNKIFRDLYSSEKRQSEIKFNAVDDDKILLGARLNENGLFVWLDGTLIRDGLVLQSIFLCTAKYFRLEKTFIVCIYISILSVLH